ncbi:MAG TPA: DNA alkylation repair protein [Anaerolineales bacterium]
MTSAQPALSSAGAVTGNRTLEIAMHPYTKSLKTLLESHGNPAQAAPMKRYMRDQFEFLGIKSPQMGELLKDFRAQHGLPPVEDLDAVVCDLWALPQREFQYAATGLIGRLEKQLPEDFISTLEYLLVTKSWWDTVDTLSGNAIGTHFARFPKTRRKTLARWRKSDNFWLRRATLLFQLGYKDKTDFDLLRELIRENLGSREFFINKAIGWSLRQYSRIDEQGVRDFVASTPLHQLSAREALSWLEHREK